MCSGDITNQALNQHIKNSLKLCYYYKIPHIFLKNYVLVFYTIPHTPMHYIHYNALCKPITHNIAL